MVRENITISGIGLSPGCAMGHAFLYGGDIGFYTQLSFGTGSSSISEADRIKTAFLTVLKQIDMTTKRIEEVLDGECANIFRVHKQMINDPLLIQRIEAELQNNNLHAEQVISNVMSTLENEFLSTDNKVYQNHGEDIADLRKRLLGALAVTRVSEDPSLHGRILVADTISPSDVEYFQQHSVSGVVIKSCGKASHSSLLLRGFGIPAVSSVGDIRNHIKNGDYVLLDGTGGLIIISPDGTRKNEWSNKIRKAKKIQENEHQKCKYPAITKNGNSIHVLANIGSSKEAQLALTYGADGIGLYRSEQFYSKFSDFPCEKQIINGLKSQFYPVKDMQITVRLLDIKGENCLTGRYNPKLSNRTTGKTGIRILFKRTDILLHQLKALVKLSDEFQIRIVVPMVTTADDMRKVRELLTRITERMRRKCRPELGAMIETPAAALCAEEIGEYSDFFSIGSNDLTQFVMAADRESEYFRDDHPAVLNLIKEVCRKVPDLEKCMCGNLAVNKDIIPELIKMGITNFSLPPLSIPMFKETVRGISTGINRNDGNTKKILLTKTVKTCKKLMWT